MNRLNPEDEKRIRAITRQNCSWVRVIPDVRDYALLLAEIDRLRELNRELLDACKAALKDLEAEMVWGPLRNLLETTIKKTSEPQ